MNGTSCQGVGAREVSVSWVMVGATEPNVGQTRVLRSAEWADCPRTVVRMGRCPDWRACSLMRVMNAKSCAAG